MTMRSTIFSSCLLCFGCSGASTTPEPSAAAAEAVSAPDVQEILTAMRERYRTAKSYRDEGTLRDVIHPKGRPDLVTTGRFRTVWAGPDRLGFELHVDAGTFQPASRLAIWTPRSGGVKSLFLENVRDDDSLSHGLYGLQGVSHGITGLVPRWLLAESRGFDGRYELQANAACGSATCFVVVGPWGDHRVTLFLDTKTYAVRKVEQRGTVTPSDHPLPTELRKRLTPEQLEAFEKDRREPFDVEVTIEYDPSFDIAVEDRDFEGALTLR